MKNGINVDTSYVPDWSSGKEGSAQFRSCEFVSCFIPLPTRVVTLHIIEKCNLLKAQNQKILPIKFLNNNIPAKFWLKNFQGQISFSSKSIFCYVCWSTYKTVCDLGTKMTYLWCPQSKDTWVRLELSLYFACNDEDIKWNEFFKRFSVRLEKEREFFK